MSFAVFVLFMAMQQHGVRAGCRAWDADCKVQKLPDRIDVPAIQVNDESAPKCPMLFDKAKPTWRDSGGNPADLVCTTVQPTKWTCKDAERILETSESGKHWCRKVQN